MPLLIEQRCCMLFLIALPLITAAVASATDANAIAVLFPDAQLAHERIEHGQSRIYKLHTEPDQEYEVRVSYPAWAPTDFQLVVFQDADGVGSVGGSDSGRARHLGRHLLNIEKAVFRTGKEGEACVQRTSYFVKLVAADAGVPVPGSPQSQGGSSVEFNIVLQTLHLGIPREAMKVGALAVAALALVARFVVRNSRR